MWTHLAWFEELYLFCFLLVQFLTLVFCHNLKPDAQFLSSARIVLHGPTWEQCRLILSLRTLAPGCLCAQNPSWCPSKECGSPLLHIGPSAGPFPGEKASPGCGGLGLTTGSGFFPEKVTGGGFSTPRFLQREKCSVWSCTDSGVCLGGSMASMGLSGG